MSDVVTRPRLVLVHNRFGGLRKPKSTRFSESSPEPEMTWFRVDDKFHDHRKVRKLGRNRLRVLGLWTLAGSWSASCQTDGFVPVEVVSKLWDSRRQLAAKLVEVDLWYETTVDGERGYQFHDWQDYQITSSELAEFRSQTARRVRELRHRRRADDDGA